MNELCEHGFYGDGCPRCQEVKLLSADAVLGDGWRDAHKEFPSDGKLYLIYADGCGSDEYYTFGIFHGGRWTDKYDTCVIDVIAWIPLPDPPAFA